MRHPFIAWCPEINRYVHCLQGVTTTRPRDDTSIPQMTMSIADVPVEVLWCAFVFAPLPTWGQINRQFSAYFAHKWVRTALVSSSIHKINRWKGHVEKLDITAADDDGWCALDHLVDACPRMWSLSLVTRSSLPLHHATTLNRVLWGSPVLTHFACELVFPSTPPLPHGNDTDNGLLRLLQIGVPHIAKNLCDFALTLKGCELCDDACTRIVAALQWIPMPCIRRLSLCLTHNHIDVRGAQAWADWIASLPTLSSVSVDMAHNRGAQGTLTQIFTTALTTLKLRVLSIRMGTQNVCGYRLQPFRFQHATLEQVHLDIGFLHGADVTAVFGALPPTVRRLSVRSNPHRLTRHPHQPHTGTAADAFVVLPSNVLEDALNQFTELQWLSLDFSGRCGVDTLRPLPAFLRRMTNLQRVQLHVGGSHGRALTDLCGILFQLGHTVVEWDLGMTGDNMTDAAVTVLAAHLARCSMHHLQLDLSHNRIGPRGWTSLVASIRNIPSLRTLHTRCNHNPIGHATPGAIFESVRVVHVELRDCNIRCLDHWIAPSLRINLAATANEWTVEVSDNDISTSQCVGLRTAGWIVVR